MLFKNRLGFVHILGVPQAEFQNNNVGFFSFIIVQDKFT